MSTTSFQLSDLPFEGYAPRAEKLTDQLVEAHSLIEAGLEMLREMEITHRRNARRAPNSRHEEYRDAMHAGMAETEKLLDLVRLTSLALSRPSVE